MLCAILGDVSGGFAIQRHIGSVEPTAPVSLSLAFSAPLLIPELLTPPAHRPSTLVLPSIVALALVCATAVRALVVTCINPAIAGLRSVLVPREHVGLGSALPSAVTLFGSCFTTAQSRKGQPRGGSTRPGQLEATVLSKGS
jgi:hypothetical protein